MSVLRIQKTKIYGKIIGAVIVECVIIMGSFVLFSSHFDLDSLGGWAPILIIGYPFFVALCTGVVTASIAATKNMAAWKWGGIAAVMTLFLIVMLVTLPSFIAGFAFLIAPVVAIAVSLNAMGVREIKQLP